jgi:hypothetical protein
MRWPWQKNPEVEEALSGSAARLAEIKKQQASLEPKLRRLGENVARNHFEDAVTRVFKVIR